MSERLDPDELAQLELEQQFLLSSLDDLDAELAAGDIDQADHDQLNDDYTRRLAEVTRAITDQRQAFAQQDASLSVSQRVLTVLGIVVVALIAGVLLGRASGFRSPQDSLTGDFRQSSTGLLAESRVLIREGRWEEAIDVFGEVLDVSPANAEALAYRGWVTNRLGDGTGLSDLDEAVAVDPDYPDARVFRAIVLNGQERFDDAAEDLGVFDSLDPPLEARSIVEGSNLRASIAAGQLAERFGDGASIDFAQVSGSPADLTDAAVALIETDLVLSLRTFDALLEQDPDNLTALVASGTVQTRADVAAASPQVAARGLERLDLAVELVPEDSQVRLLRALARERLDDGDGAAADLEMIDPDQLPEELLVEYDRMTGAG